MKDSYNTIESPSTGEFRDRGSKFIAYAFSVENEEEALAHLEEIRRKHPKARHHCFAYRLGMDGDNFRANDDGEPSGTAGRPILGQIDSFGLTNVVVIVVRYFGGTKLGTSGLIQAYKNSTAEALANATIIERILQSVYKLTFGYDKIGDVMSAVERCRLKMLDQNFEAKASVTIAVRQSEAEQALTELKAHIASISLNHASKLEALEGIDISYEGTRK
jgi:uncharacterized YigZ family protein